MKHTEYGKEKSTQVEVYLLKNEKDSLPLGYQILQEIVLYLPQQKVWVENNQIEIGWLSLQEVLSLRSVSNESLVLEHFDPTCENARDIALLPIMPPRPSFYIYDHLGNTRVVFKGNLTNCTTPTLVLEYLGDYYPYGKTLREFVPSGKTEKYLTTQHERDIETGLDYRGARYYDADLARFLTLDPLANKYMGYSPYNYVLGNPVMLIDPDGNEAQGPGDPPYIPINGLYVLNNEMKYYFAALGDLVGFKAEAHHNVSYTSSLNVLNVNVAHTTTINSGAEFETNFKEYFLSNRNEVPYKSGVGVYLKTEMKAAVDVAKVGSLNVSVYGKKEESTKGSRTAAGLTLSVPLPKGKGDASLELSNTVNASGQNSSAVKFGVDYTFSTKPVTTPQGVKNVVTTKVGASVSKKL